MAERPESDLWLVLAGGLGWKTAAIEAALAAAAERRVRHFGYLPEARLQALYRGAEWLVFPSLYEGFGLPVAEAMAAGVPLLLADLPVLRELAGEAALYAPPGDAAAWAALLGRAADDRDGGGELRAGYAARSRERPGISTGGAPRRPPPRFFRRGGAAGGGPAGGGMKLAPGMLEPSPRVWRWLLGSLLAALALGGHVYWWYWPRVHAAVPDPDAPFTAWLRNESFAYSVWIPYPHQNLAALRRLGGLGSRELKAMGRLAGLPEPHFPSFGSLSLPPSSALAALSDHDGQTFAVAADVYPVFAWFSWLAGKVAGNPWLGGGEVLVEGRRMIVRWQGNVWTVASPVEVPLHDGEPAGGGRRAAAGAAAGEDPQRARAGAARPSTA